MEDKRKKAPEEGPNGVDRWTSNGYGVKLDGNPVKPQEDSKPEELDEIEEV